jgi:hypothetical protein
MNVTVAVAEKVSEFNLFLNKIAKISNSTIHIQTHNFGTAFSCYQEELLLDMFETCYSGQQIVVIADDGENFEHRGLITFFENLCQQGIVPRHSITFESHHQEWNYNFNHKTLSYNIFSNTKRNFQGTFDNVNHDAKFIGCMISRFTPGRFNLAYQLDYVFPNDNFLIFRPSIAEVNAHYSFIDSAYQHELEWIKYKKFETDEILDQTLQGSRFVPWQQSTSTYYTVWPKYQIECVAETDVFSHSWFTEKTARCLASGKPFVLFSGPGSLKTLKKFGFQTFNDVIDESYDSELTPRSRMTAMLQSLKDLYNDIDKNTKINQLTQIAKYNQSIYDEICRKI